MIGSEIINGHIMEIVEEKRMDQMTVVISDLIQEIRKEVKLEREGMVDINNKNVFVMNHNHILIIQMKKRLYIVVLVN